jgi:hypothetical protein
MIGILLRIKQDQLQSFLQNSILLEKYIDSEEMQEHETKLDIHKYWDGINYLLTHIEKPNPLLSRVIFSGQILDEEQDLGYGPAQYLTAEQVKEVNTQLNRLSDSDLTNAFNASDMNSTDVYLNPWEGNPEEIEVLIKYINEIKAFYADANRSDEAVITYLT